MRHAKSAGNCEYNRKVDAQMNHHEPKTALTPQEKIKAAYLHYVRGINQHDIAVAFEVNPGRVNEACKAVWEAVCPMPEATTSSILMGISSK